MQSILLHGDRFLLHPFRAMLWERTATLLLADLHLGKARHFRRAGIPVPQGVADATWDRLLSLLVDLQPRRVLFLGDLFHSDYNREWEELGDLTAQFDFIRFELVRGNHDILPGADYERVGIRLHRAELPEGPFVFSHHPLTEVPAGYYNLAGHVHPAVRLRGRARQRTRLPCFYFGREQALLPAFGQFTGTQVIAPREGDQVYVIVEEEVVRVG